LLHTTNKNIPDAYFKIPGNRRELTGSRNKYITPNEYTYQGSSKSTVNDSSKTPLVSNDVASNLVSVEGDLPKLVKRRYKDDRVRRSKKLKPIDRYKGQKERSLKTSVYDGMSQRSNGNVSEYQTKISPIPMRGGRLKRISALHPKKVKISQKPPRLAHSRVRMKQTKIEYRPNENIVSQAFQDMDKEINHSITNCVRYDRLANQINDDLVSPISGIFPIFKPKKDGFQRSHNSLKPPTI
jgi:hypothetical protein